MDNKEFVLHAKIMDLGFASGAMIKVGDTGDCTDQEIFAQFLQGSLMGTATKKAQTETKH